MNVTQLLLRAVETGAQEDRVRFMAEVGRLIARRVWLSDMWDVENSPLYFGFREYRRWIDIYPADFEGNVERYASADPTTDFFIGSHECGPEIPQATSPPVTRQPPSRFEQAFAEGGRLGAMARRGDDVGGYLATMARNYLHDRQKKNDPFGYRAFKNLEAVVEGLAGDGVVVVTGRVGRKQRIRRSSGVRFRTAVTGSSATAPAAAAVLAAPTLAGNVHKLAKLGRGAQRLLRPAVAALPDAGVAGFQFGELLTPLQDRVRDAARIWFGDPAVVSHGQVPGGVENLEETRTADPFERYGMAEYLEALIGTVRRGIDGGAFQERTRLELHRVLDDWIEYMTESQSLDHPTYSEWARRLGVPRATIENHVQRLRKIIDQAFAGSVGTVP